jgi:CubicO group peptidase (beta-lactamase class C family)
MRPALWLAALLVAAGCSDAPTAPTAPVRVDLSSGRLRASPGEVGMSAFALLGAAGDASAIPRFRSLLVARHGRLVAEYYFGGGDSTTLFDVRSVTKSVVCALTGIALFGALGVQTVAWEPLDRGTVNGGSGIALRARDLLKFGQLFLQLGWSGDASVVPEAWVDSVTRPQFTWRTAVGPLRQVTYGMLWWVSDADPAAFFAWGYGGQFVYVVPSRDLVVVATTDWVQLTEITSTDLAAQVLGVIVDDVAPAAR